MGVSHRWIYNPLFAMTIVNAFRGLYIANAPEKLVVACLSKKVDRNGPVVMLGLLGQIDDAKRRKMNCEGFGYLTRQFVACSATRSADDPRSVITTGETQLPKQ